MEGQLHPDVPPEQGSQPLFWDNQPLPPQEQGGMEVHQRRYDNLQKTNPSKLSVLVGTWCSGQGCTSATNEDTARLESGTLSRHTTANEHEARSHETCSRPLLVYSVPRSSGGFRERGPKRDFLSVGPDRALTGVGEVCCGILLGYLFCELGVCRWVRRSASCRSWHSLISSRLMSDG